MLEGMASSTIIFIPRANTHQINKTVDNLNLALSFGSKGMSKEWYGVLHGQLSPLH